MALQIKRGTNLERLNLILLAGEPFFVTNFAALGVSPFWIGDGSTYGGVAVMPNELDELTDVAIASNELVDTQVIQYESATGLWKNKTNLVLNGTATFNNTVTAKSTDTTTSVVNPFNSTHLYDRRTRYDSLNKDYSVPGDNNTYYLGVNRGGFSNFPIFTTGTKFRFTYLPNDYVTNNILSTSTDYYIFGSTISRFFIATNLANAQNGIGISNISPLTGDGARFVPGGTLAQVDPFAENLGVGIQYNLQNRGGEAEYVAAKINAEKVSDSDSALKFFVRDDSAIPASPQLTINANGDLTVDRNLIVDSVNATVDLNADGSVNATGTINANSTTNSSSITTGALVVDGGVGIAKNVYIGQNLNVAGTTFLTGSNFSGDVAITSTTQSNGPTTGALTVAGGVGIAKILNVAGDTRIDSNTASSSTSTGALRVSGGVGIGGALYANSANITNNLTVGGDLTVNGTTTTINSTTLTVDDKNIELASTASPTDAAADGGGITLKGTTDKTILWVDATDSWTFNQAIASSAGAQLGNVTIGKANDQTVSTVTGELTLSAANGIIGTSAAFISTGSIQVDNVKLQNNLIQTVSGLLYLTGSSTNPGVVVESGHPLQVDSSLITNSNVQFNGSVITDMKFSDSSTSMRGIRGTAGANDFWFVGGDASSSDNAQLILATGDNGNEPIVIRQYTGAIEDANTSYRELVLLDSSGNTTLPGNLNVANLNTAGTEIVINYDHTGSPTDNGQVRVERGTSSDAVLRWNETTDRWQYGTEASLFNMPDQSLDIASSPTFTNLTVTGDGYIYSSTDLALDLSGADVRVAGDLTVSGNDIKSSSATAITLNGADVAVVGDVSVGDDLTVIGNNVNLAQASIIGYDDNNDRLNRPSVRSTTGNQTGFRAQGPNTSTSSTATLSAFSSNDLNNGRGLSLVCNNGTTNPYRIQMNQYVSGVVGSGGSSLQFIDGASTIIATINPNGPTDSTDLVTKSYLEAGTSQLAQIKIDSVAVVDSATLTTTTTTADQVVDSNDAATYRSAKYQVQITSATDYQAMEILLIHNGTTASIAVYADIKTGSTDLATFTADINGGNFRLLTTPTNATTTYKVTKTLITV